nr:DNA replication licensing factor MCM2 [Tanacetum cinerariifolium]
MLSTDLTVTSEPYHHGESTLSCGLDMCGMTRVQESDCKIHVAFANCMGFMYRPSSSFAIRICVKDYVPKAVRASPTALKATVHYNPATQESTLKGGALVLADKGICLINDIDQIDDENSQTFHDAISLHISEATPDYRCTIIAGATPIGGRYDSSKTFWENVLLKDHTVFAFDVLCVVKVDDVKKIMKTVCAMVDLELIPTQNLLPLIERENTIHDHLKRNCPKNNRKKSSGYVNKDDQPSSSGLIYDGFEVMMVMSAEALLDWIMDLGEEYTIKLQSGKIKVINGSRIVLSGTRRDNCVYSLDGNAVAGAGKAGSVWQEESRGNNDDDESSNDDDDDDVEKDKEDKEEEH